MTRLVKQEVIVDLGQFAGLQRQEFERAIRSRARWLAS